MADNKCDKYGCIANLDGECASDECKGELKVFAHGKRYSDREALRKYYAVMTKMFEEDFGNKKGSESYD